MKISEMIKALQQIKLAVGDKEIEVSGDPEGNTYSSFTAPIDFTQDDGKIVVFPASKRVPN